MRYSLLLISAWLLFLATDLLAPQSARTTSITFVNLDGPGEGFNDATPVAPVGDNTGTTLGAQRQKAAQFAADIWADFISSKVPIVVDARFDAPNSEHPGATDPFNSLDCTTNPPVIATAEPTTYHGNFAKAPKTNTWYPQALANSLAGKDLSTSSDIRAYFNSSVGTPQCLPDKGWFYGLNGIAPPDQFDFVTVVLRELAHGLGFITTVNLANGQKLGSFDDVFSLKLKDVSTGLLFSQMTDAERLIAIRNTGNLRWIGDNVVAAHGGDMPMYAPPDIDVDFSVSNWHTSLQSGSVTIAAGSSTALITVTPIDDALEEGSETVTLTLSPDSAYTVDSPSSATVTIADNDSSPPTVTIEADLPDASETGPTVGRFTVTRSTATASPLIVNYAIGGTALNGIDYTTLSGSVTIPASSATATIDVTPIDDALVEGTETVILALRANPAYAVGTPDDAMVTITDSDSTPLPAVSIVASLPDASEAGPTPTAGQFTVSRTGSTAAELNVSFTIGGTAINGTDYGSLQSPVKIEAGSSTALIPVNPLADTRVEDSETVTLTLIPSATYTVISPSSATVTIADEDSAAPPPTVSIEANLPNAWETGPTAGQFTVSRTGITTAQLIVKYAISGTATNGTDYTTLPTGTSVTILAGSSTALITVNPINDALVEGNEVVVLSLLVNPAAYTRGSPSSATVTIADNDSPPPPPPPPPPFPTVTISATSPNASEAGPTPGQFTVTRTGSTAKPLTVNYTISGTATNGTDYTIGPQELLEPFYTTPNHDVGLALEVLADIGWPLDPGGTVKITALDDAVKEGTPTGFIVHRTGATDQPITVHYKISGTAKGETDYETLLDHVDIPAGESSATITVTPFFDAISKERDETVIIALLADPNPIPGSPPVPHYTLGFPTAATVTIQNNVVKFGAGAAPAGEVGVPYNFDLAVSGGEEPYVVTISKGALPDGLALGSPVISGTPSSLAKTATFTITVKDLQDVSVSKSYKITVLKAVNITTTSLKNGQINKPYTATLKATGGKLKYTWTLDALSPLLPSGLSLSANGVISGTPATGTAGVFHPTVKVTDALGGTDEQALTLTIN